MTICVQDAGNVQQKLTRRTEAQLAETAWEVTQIVEQQ